MSAVKIINFIGLVLITCGSIGAALGAPAPQYKSDGSVGLAASDDKNVRIAMHRRQKRFPYFLIAVAIGAALQAAANFL